MLRAIGLLRTINRYVALTCGVVLLFTAAFVLSEISLRGLSLPNLGGADEISGYIMAGVTAWGLSVALTERAHIRIEMAVSRLRSFWRDVIDVAALSTFAAISTTVTVYGWTVLSKSIHGASRANTPLETPLWIPQVVWWSGWIWFSITSCLVAIIAAGLFVTRRSNELRSLAGTEEEAEA